MIKSQTETYPSFVNSSEKLWAHCFQARFCGRGVLNSLLPCRQSTGRHLSAFNQKRTRTQALDFVCFHQQSDHSAAPICFYDSQCGSQLSSCSNFLNFPSSTELTSYKCSLPFQAWAPRSTRAHNFFYGPFYRFYCQCSVSTLLCFVL